MCQFLMLLPVQVFSAVQNSYQLPPRHITYLSNPCGIKPRRWMIGSQVKYMPVGSFFCEVDNMNR